MYDDIHARIVQNQNTGSRIKSDCESGIELDIKPSAYTNERKASL